ncbi:MAG: hypothetical protein V3G42_11955 [Oscillospiraceae bacterium]
MLCLFYEDFTLQLPLSLLEVNQKFSAMVFYGKNQEGQSLFMFQNQEEIDFDTPQFFVTLSPIEKDCYVIVKTKQTILKRFVRLFIVEWWCSFLSARTMDLWWLPLPLLAVILVMWIYYAVRFSLKAIPAKRQFLELFSETGGKLLPPVNVFTDEIHLF